MTTSTAINYEKHIPDVLKQMASVHDSIDAHHFDKTIYHLVLLRASQINQCSFCVKMHTEEARADGETTKRLDHVIVWQHSQLFTKREKAALCWTEALTHLTPNTNYGELRKTLREHFNENEMSALTANIGMINLWNRMGVSAH